MAAITVQNVTKDASLTPSFVAASELGDYFANTGKIIVYAKNVDAGDSKVITVASQVQCSLGSTHNITVTVPASSEEIVGFFSVDRFNDANGRVQMTYDDHTDLTLAAISIE